MLVDLHAHYPMHVGPPDPWPVALKVWSGRGRASFVDRFDATVLGYASRLWNWESARAGPRVPIGGMRAGGVDVALSVLCTPLLEMGNRLTTRYSRKPPYGAPPEDRYTTSLLRQMDAVEQRVTRKHPHTVEIARSPDEIDAAQAAGRLALVHCVEGGFSLGASPESIERTVRVLAARGVAYVTLAHLAWRHVATNVTCMPFASDDLYERIFPQPDIGLSELGRAAVRALVAEGVLIDITHMSQAALDDTFSLLDELDPEATVPVIASHCGYRFGGQDYNLDDATIRRIAARDGVIGLMLSTYFMADGLDSEPSSLDESLELLCRHIDAIHGVTGSYANVGVGTDLDGFIKPTLPGLGDSAQLGRLAPALEVRYGRATAEAIRSDNAMRVLRTGWRGTRVPNVRDGTGIAPGLDAEGVL
jgi:microsomal dipeptidase-like Zn-dependent dipeptidase